MSRQERIFVLLAKSGRSQLKVQWNAAVPDRPDLFRVLQETPGSRPWTARGQYTVPALNGLYQSLAALDSHLASMMSSEAMFGPCHGLFST